MRGSIIRFAKEEDLPAIVELCELHAIYERVEYDPENKIEKIKSRILTERPEAFCIVAEVGKERVGYATFMKQFSTWDATFYIYIDCLFVKSKFRSNGIGEDILRKIKLEATRLGCRQIQWQTPTFNQRAIKFYERIGAVSKTKERFFLEI